MVFAYYNRLNAAQRRTYRKSDACTAISLTDATALQPRASAIAEALRGGERASVHVASQTLVDAITAQLGAPPVRLRVLTSRPHDADSELHGLYEPVDGNRAARISVWMLTAKQRRVVAFRTYLRTLLHELCHHLDYELFGLDESFHTEGFYKRESSLFNQLVPGAPAQARA
ncbi:MAG: hypothetical protein P8009_07780 [Gammaproteobacteria bacterium]